MDHKMAIVIAPSKSLNRVEASRIILTLFHSVQMGDDGPGSSYRFRSMHVGGWFGFRR